MSRITIKELAEACGVAVSTVSRAMNDRSDVNPATKERILATAKELGYVPNASARSLKIASTKAIAVIIQGDTSELLVRLLGELEAQLALSGYDAFLSHVSDRKAQASTVEQIVSERKFSGVIFLGRYGDTASKDAASLSRRLAAINVPIVFCTTADFSGSPSLHSSVSVDDFGGAAELTRYLLGQGHRRIAFATMIQDSSPTSGHAWAQRYSGYRSALEDAGISHDPLLEIPAVDPTQLYSMTNGYESVKSWLSQGAPKFTAIVSSCDAVALGASRALQEGGIRIPEDCSLTGFDGLGFARFAVPSLTTVLQPLDNIAAATSRVLLAAIGEPRHATEQVWIRGEMLLGESTGPVTP